MRYLIQSLMLATFLLGSVAYAENQVTSGYEGNYFGVQVGGSRVKGQAQDLPDNLGNVVSVTPSSNGFGLRLYWGYQFVQYLGLEAGWAHYSPSVYNIPNGNSPQIRIQALDFVGKATLPLWWGVDVYGKGGAALVYYQEGGLLAPNPTGGQDGSSGFTVRPEIGVGASYSFTPNWTVDASLIRILKGGQVPTSDLYVIGITYHAVDLYCGQFLC